MNPLDPSPNLNATRVVPRPVRRDVNGTTSIDLRILQWKQQKGAPDVQTCTETSEFIRLFGPYLAEAIPKPAPEPAPAPDMPWEFPPPPPPSATEMVGRRPVAGPDAHKLMSLENGRKTPEFFAPPAAATAPPAAQFGPQPQAAPGVSMRTFVLTIVGVVLWLHLEMALLLLVAKR